MAWWLIGVAVLGPVVSFGVWLLVVRFSGNLHAVEAGALYRSGQLNGSALRDALTRHGIRTVINLRGASAGQSWYDDELVASKALGVLHFDFAMSSRREIDDETLRQLSRLLQKIPTPLLVHCKGGADRSGLVAAIFLYAIRGRPAAEARRQLSFRYAHLPWLSPSTRAMDRTFNRFAKIAAELKPSPSGRDNDTLAGGRSEARIETRPQPARLPWWILAAYRAKYFGIRMVAGAVRMMPLDVATWLAGNLHCLWASWGGRHARILANLERAFPRKSSDERQAIAMAMWQNIGRTAAEVVHLNRFLAEPDRVDLVGAHLVDRCRGEKGPTICVTLHSGNWELGMLPFAMRGLKPAAIYKLFPNPYVDRYVTTQREKLLTGGLLPMGGGVRESAAVQDTSRRLVSYVRKSGPIGFLADHHDHKGILVPFFGHAVRSTRVPAMLARHFGARLLILRTVRLGPQSRFLLEVKELEVAQTADRAADIRSATAAMQRQFEVWIREFPEQWTWTRAQFAPGKTDKVGGANPARKLRSSWHRYTLTPDKSDRVTLLGQCLAFGEAAVDPDALRRRVASDDAVWSEIVAAALPQGLLPAVADRLAAKGLLPPEPQETRVAAVSPARQLRDHLISHGERRKAQRAHLIEIVRALNGNGVECILLRDAQTLWLKEPEWRHLRNLEILTAAGEWAAAQAALMDIGYQKVLVKGLGSRLRPRHEVRFVKPELPGWVDIRLGYNRYAESLLPIAEVVRNSIPVVEDGVRVRLLPPPLFVLNSLIGHHFARGLRAHEIPIEGLYEFAWWMAHQATQHGSRLRERAAQDPRLLAALNFWIAVAVDVFCLPLEPPFNVCPNATEQWLQVKPQIGSRLEF